MAGERVSIVVVCTANQCRSPLTAASFRKRAGELGLPVDVTSAGTQVVTGLPPTEPTIDAARRIELDLGDHTSTPLSADDVRHADLVLGLERRHVQEIVLWDSTSFGKAFTLKELVRRGSDVGPRGPSEQVADWLARVHEGRRPVDMLGISADDDIIDPTGSTAVDHRSTAEEVDALAAAILGLLFPA